jgi:DNA-binding PadR family transcriptional regulator
MARKSSSGPGTDPELLILSSLAAGPKHGYAVMQDVAIFAGVNLGPGTLYTAITRLMDQQCIEPLEATGLDYLRAQLEAMRRLASCGLRRLRTA